MKKLNPYLKIAEAATFLGVSQNTLRKGADAEIGRHLTQHSSFAIFANKPVTTITH